MGVSKDKAMTAKNRTITINCKPACVRQSLGRIKPITSTPLFKRWLRHYGDLGEEKTIRVFNDLL